MNQANNITRKHVGVDVSKAKLDCWKATKANKGGSFKSFANSGKGVKALLKWIPAGGHVVVEATGGYEELAVVTCHNLGVPVSVVNPKSVRDMANAQGRRAKTDRLDAELIARFADIVEPAPAPKPTKAQTALAAHVDLRENLVADRTRQLNRLEKETNPSLRSLLKSMIARFEKAISKIDKQIEAIIASCPKMTLMCKELRSIPGIGQVISSTLVALLPQLGTLSRRQVSALCGLAPYARDSGTKKGKRFISGGRGKLRRRLYMGALSLAKHQSPMAAQYRAMVARGKLKMVALVALARKLAILANTTCKPLSSLPYATH